MANPDPIPTDPIPTDPIPPELLSKLVTTLEELMAAELFERSGPTTVLEAFEMIEARLERSTSVAQAGFGSLIVNSPGAPPFLDVNHGNLDVVGPSRWIVRDGELAVRVDVPPGAPRRLIRYCVRDALDLAGYRRPQLTQPWNSRRLRTGIDRLHEAMRKLGLDPERLLRVAHGYVAAYDVLADTYHADERRLGRLVSPVLEGGRTVPGYCLLHVVRGARGDTLLRVSAFAGWMPRSVALDYNDSQVQMARLVQIGQRSAGRTPLDPKAATLAVSDLDLLEVDSGMLDSVTSAVATYANNLRREWPGWPDRGRRRSGRVVTVGYAALGRSPRPEPVELVDAVLPVVHFASDPFGVVDLRDGPPQTPPQTPEHSIVDLDELTSMIASAECFDGEEPFDDGSAGGHFEDPFDADWFDDGADGDEADEDVGGDSDQSAGSLRVRREGREAPRSMARGRCGICGDRAEGSWCECCADAIDDGPASALELLHSNERIELARYVDLRGEMSTSEPSRRRQAEYRVGKLLADLAPRLDLATIDFEATEQRIADAFSRIGPGYRAALEVLEALELHRADHLPSFLLHGPPGAGKSLVATVLAAALGMPGHVEQLGGAAGRQVFTGDEALWTSSGPGVLAESIVRHRTLQMVMCLDEIEKFAGVNQDPMPWAALLSALDDQRSRFTDRFLGGIGSWPLDLRHMLFIATANELHLVADPLKSRMQVIEVPGWTPEEKVVLAERVLGEQLREAGLEVRTHPDVARFLVDRRPDPGVRELLADIGRLVGWLLRRGRGDDVSELEVRHLGEAFPPARPTPVARRLPAAFAPGVGMLRTAALDVEGWVEMRCSAVANRHWGGHAEALGADLELLDRWVADLPAPVPPCLLHVEQPTARPPWLALAMLVAAVSAAADLVPADDVVVLAAADVHGLLLSRTSGAGGRRDVDGTDLVGLRLLGFERVVVATEPDLADPTWQRDDLPRIEVAHTVEEMLALVLPGFEEWRRRATGPGGGAAGYL